jgi:acylphosphatase
MAKQQTRVVVRYTGNVQGVGFRITAISQARGLSINGFVRNEPDGSVLMDVEGIPRDIKELMRRIESEMSHNIDGIEVADREPTGAKGGFRIRHA